MLAGSDIALRAWRALRNPRQPAPLPIRRKIIAAHPLPAKSGRLWSGLIRAFGSCRGPPPGAIRPVRVLEGRGWSRAGVDFHRRGRSMKLPAHPSRRRPLGGADTGAPDGFAQKSAPALPSGTAMPQPQHREGVTQSQGLQRRAARQAPSQDRRSHGEQHLEERRRAYCAHYSGGPAAREDGAGNADEQHGALEQVGRIVLGLADSHGAAHPDREKGFRKRNGPDSKQQRSPVLLAVASRITPRPPTSRPAKTKSAGRHFTSSFTCLVNQGSRTNVTAAPRPSSSAEASASAISTADLPRVEASDECVHFGRPPLRGAPELQWLRTCIPGDGGSILALDLSSISTMVAMPSSFSEACGAVCMMISLSLCGREIGPSLRMQKRSGGHERGGSNSHLPKRPLSGDHPAVDAGCRWKSRRSATPERHPHAKIQPM